MNYLLETYGQILPELFGTSQVRLKGVPAYQKLNSDLAMNAEQASGTKCESCWRYTEDVGVEANYPTACLRCAEALEAIHFPPYNATPTETPA